MTAPDPAEVLSDQVIAALGNMMITENAWASAGGWDVSRADVEGFRREIRIFAAETAAPLIRAEAVAAERARIRHPVTVWRDHAGRNSTPIGAAELAALNAVLDLIGGDM